jgi:hypothetical protein
MFTWICPKCGKEVPPAYSECPNCSAKEQAVPVEQPATPAQAPPAAVRARPRRPGIPGWVWSIVSAVVFVGLGVGAFLLFRSSPETPAAATPATPGMALETPGARAAAPAASPVFKDVELTGLRLTEDKMRKTFLQLVVVNHSGADLGDFSAKVDLKSAKAGPEDPPVGTFTLKTSLGPYEAKDLKVPVNTKLRVYELPDWQLLRAEITAQ